jgi:hypothetical protein
MPRRIDGNNVLYHYIQKVILARQDAFARRLVRDLILDLSIWLPVELYQAAPVLLPFSLRDSSVKSKEWGSPTAEGYLRDNNSLLKLLVGSYTIRSPLTSVYPSKGRGRNFTASHAWRRIRIDGSSCFSTAHPRTYSFIPNLVWLPAQVAKLTDHEGSYAQQLLQAVSHRLYRLAATAHPPALAGIWDALPAPAMGLPSDEDGTPGLAGEFDPTRLNFFAVSSRSIKMRRNILLRETEVVLRAVESGRAGEDSPRSFRYLAGLVKLPREQLTGMVEWLEIYRVFLQAG